MINYRVPGNVQSAAVFAGRYQDNVPALWRWNNPVRWRMTYGEYASKPTGYRQNAQIMPMKDGGIAVTIATGGTLTASAAGSLGVVAADLAGIGSLAATGFLTASRTVSIAGLGALTGSPSGSLGNIACTIKIGTLTQDDVTGAVMEAQIEAGLTLRQVIRLLAAVAAGKTDIIDLGGGNATVKFRDLADTKDRINASMTGSKRTSVTRDVS
jgi:hypothetical protein